MRKVVGEPVTHKGKKFPLCDAVIANELIFVSGQIAVNADGALVGTTIEEQSRQVIKNVERVLQEAGAALANIVKTTVWVTEKENFPGFNNVYSEFFMATTPARATVRADLMLPGALVEMDAVAVMPTNEPTAHSLIGGPGAGLG